VRKEGKVSREFVHSLGQLAKTDRLDAQILAQFGHSARSGGRLQLTQLLPAAEAELKALVRRRRQLIGMLVAETNRRQRATKVVKKSIVASIRGLKRALTEEELADSPVQDDQRGRLGILRACQINSRTLIRNPKEKASHALACKAFGRKRNLDRRT